MVEGPFRCIGRWLCARAKKRPRSREAVCDRNAVDECSVAVAAAFTHARTRRVHYMLAYGTAPHFAAFTTLTLAFPATVLITTAAPAFMGRSDLNRELGLGDGVDGNWRLSTHRCGARGA